MPATEGKQRTAGVRSESPDLCAAQVVTRLPGASAAAADGAAASLRAAVAELPLVRSARATTSAGGCLLRIEVEPDSVPDAWRQLRRCLAAARRNLPQGVEAPRLYEDAALARHVEEASLNAWPALEQMLVDGWVLRFSRGFTRRANSITPLYPALREAAGKVAYCEELYGRAGLPALFRLTSIAGLDAYGGRAAPGELDAVLAQRGYVADDRTLVMHRHFGPAAAEQVGDGAEFHAVSLAQFASSHARLAGLEGAAAELHRLLLCSIRARPLFGELRAEGEVVACGMAVPGQELAGLFDIVTHPGHRRRGFGRRLVEQLLVQADSVGASQSYLQVDADNDGARALYAQLGFEPLYEYGYRVPPD